MILFINILLIDVNSIDTVLTNENNKLPSAPLPTISRVDPRARQNSFSASPLQATHAALTLAAANLEAGWVAFASTVATPHQAARFLVCYLLQYANSRLPHEWKISSKCI
jgi:hypothetical protein